MSRNEAFSRVKIDAQLKDQGWDVLNPNAVRFEYVLPDKSKADYVLCDRHGRALAVIKRLKGPGSIYQSRISACPADRVSISMACRCTSCSAATIASLASSARKTTTVTCTGSAGTIIEPGPFNNLLAIDRYRFAAQMAALPAPGCGPWQPDNKMIIENRGEQKYER